MYRHPERSRGIFLAEGDNVVCVIAEKGKPFAKGARKSRVQGRFLAALEMTVWENGFISRSVQRICLENAIHATSSRAKPSIFLAHRYSVVCVTAEKGKPFAKGARKNRVQGGFLDCARNDSVGNGYLVHHAKKECVGNAFFSYRHRKRSRGIFFVGGKRASV